MMKIFSIYMFLLMLALNVKATNYYVNDASIVGDVYTTVVGAAGNNGLTPSTPKASIQAIMTSYVLVGGDKVYIDAGSYTQDVLISGISGSGTYIEFIGAGTSLTTITGVAGGSAFTVHLLNSSYISWKNVKVISQTGEWAFSIYMNSHYNLISNCETDADQYGVDIERNATGTAPTNNIVENCIVKSKYVGIRIKSENTQGGWAVSATTGPMDNIVRDNVVTVTGATVFAAQELQTTRANSIYRNKFISTGNGVGGTVFLGHFCTGVVIQNNYVVNHSTYVDANTANPAIMFDDNSGANIIHNSFYAESHAFYFVDGGAANTLTNVTLYNNIFYSNLKNAIHFPADNAKFNFCDGNMYYAPAGFVASTNGTNRTLASWQTYDPDGANAGSEANGYNTNPLYVAPATNNLDLSSGSPAIDVVVVATSVIDDIYQTSRPQGPAKDIGAYELELPSPVGLIFFKANCNGEAIELSWATSWEIDNAGFNVQRSTDGINFTTIAAVQGIGNSKNFNEYAYMDLYSGKAFYRLEQVDFDGHSSVSGIISAGCSEVNPVKIYSSRDHVRIDVSGNSCIIALYTVSGQLLLNKDYQLEEGLNSIIVNRPVLDQEIYIIQVISGDQRVSKKIIFDNK